MEEEAFPAVERWVLARLHRLGGGRGSTRVDTSCELKVKTPSLFLKQSARNLTPCFTGFFNGMVTYRGGRVTLALVRVSTSLSLRFRRNTWRIEDSRSGGTRREEGRSRAFQTTWHPRRLQVPLYRHTFMMNVPRRQTSVCISWSQ
jgi:hypothetical protein